MFQNEANCSEADTIKETSFFTTFFKIVHQLSLKKSQRQAVMLGQLYTIL
jgi:hypothetical protein